MKKVFYVGFNVIIAVGLAAIWVSQNDGFGKGDISPFFFQTLVLSLLSLLMIKPLNWVFNKTNEILGLLLSLIISLVQTIVFILLLWFFIGPWIGAISFPFQLIWLTSISISNIYILISSKNAIDLRYVARVSLIPIAILITVKIYDLGKDILSSEQNYDLICITFTPNDTVLEPENDLTRFGLHECEADLVMRNSPLGTYYVGRFFRVQDSKLVSTNNPEYNFNDPEDFESGELDFMFGNRIDSNTRLLNRKIILVMNHPLKTTLEFREPIDSSLLLIQDVHTDTFKEIYLGEEKNLKSLKVSKTNFSSFPHWTNISFDFKGNGYYRCAAFQWFKF